MSDLNLAINISAIDSASNILRGVGKAISDLASGNVAGAAMAAGALVVGVGAASVKMAADFQAGLVSLSTGAGEAQGNLKMVGDGILALAVSTGTSTKQLTDGMYMIESAGYHGAAGLKVLQTAAEGAKVGNADLGVTANALTTILTDYHMSADQSTSAMNGLTATVASGKTHLQDLASSMSAVLPLASSLGIRFPEVAGALATMTNAGMSAQHASQNLANAIRSLSAPGSTATKSMKAVGLSAQDLKDAVSKDLPTALQMIEDHIGKKFPAGSIEATTALKNIMGGATGLNVALMLGGQNMQAFQGNINGISKAMDAGGNSVTGWNQVQDTFNFKMSQAQQAVNVLMIKLGQHLLPVLTQLAGDIAPMITQLQNWGHNILQVVQFFQQHQDAMNALKAVMIGVAGAILVAVVPAFWAWATAAAAAALETLIAAAPFILLAAIIAAVVFGIMEAVQHWGQIVAWLKGVWGGISSWFSGVLNGVRTWFVWLGATVKADLTKAWQAIQNATKVALAVLVNIVMGPIFAIAGFFIWLYNHNIYFKQLVDSITNIIKAGLAWLQGAWQFAIEWIVAQWNALVVRATAIWDQVSKTIHDKFTQAIGFVQSIWQTISSFFVNAWNTYIAGPLTALWNNVSSVFSNAWNTYIATPLTNIWNQISKWFTNLGTSAMNSGKNFISMLVSGIASGAGAIWNAVVGIANTIWRALGFHSPAEAGPGADADKWMPNLVNMLSTSLIAGVPKMQAAANAIAQPLTTIASPPAATGPAVTSQATSNNNNAVEIHVHLEGSGSGPDAQRRGKDIADVVKRELAKHLRQQSIAPRYTSGGTHQ